MRRGPANPRRIIQERVMSIAQQAKPLSPISSIPCNLCGASEVEVLSLRDRRGKPLRTVICRRCGLIWSDPRPAGNAISDFYSKNYRMEYKGSYIPKMKHIYRDIKESIRRFDFLTDIVSRDSVILDVGSGTGVFVYAMRQRGYDARGIEPDERYAAFSRDHFDIPIETRFVSDIFTPEAYDIITLHHVLEHLEDPGSALIHIKTLLKRNGYVVIEVPNAEDERQDPHNRYHKAHLYTFNVDTLKAILELAGFRYVKMHIASFNGNISVIFQSGQSSTKTSLNMPENCLRIMNTLNSHTIFRHFLTYIPYKKLLDNVIKTIWERIAIRKFTRPRDLVDSCLRNHQSYMH